MVQSCNGLQLLQVITPQHQRKLYYVYNWTNGHSKMIPLPTYSIYVFCNLAFDPLRSLHYKIVCAMDLGTLDDQCQFGIYSSETGEWKATEVTANGFGLIGFESGVYWNGAIYWIKYCGSRLEFYCFDVEARNLTPITMDPQLQRFEQSDLEYFGECNGHLHLVCLDTQESKYFNILEMDRATMTWFVKYIVSVDRLISAFPEVYVGKRKGFNKYCCAFSVSCVVRGIEERDEAIVMLIPGRIYK